MQEYFLHKELPSFSFLKTKGPRGNSYLLYSYKYRKVFLDSANPTKSKQPNCNNNQLPVPSPTHKKATGKEDQACEYVLTYTAEL